MLSANFNIMPNKAPIHIMITGFFFFIAITADVITIINDIRLSDVNIFETEFPTVPVQKHPAALAHSLLFCL